MRKTYLLILVLGVLLLPYFMSGTVNARQVAVTTSTTTKPLQTVTPTQASTTSQGLPTYDASHFGPCPASWVPTFKPDAELYPFSNNCFRHDLGTLHYVDEGSKTAPETILFVHGNPNWSFMFHDAMNYMVSKGYRVVSLDQFGFGLSDSLPPAKFDYTPRHQSEILEELVVGLDLKRITLVVHDWGGPIGLGMAGRQPDRIARLVINNTTGFSLDLNTDGYVSRGAQWGKIAQSNSLLLSSQCLIVKSASTEEAYAYDPTEGDLYKRVYAMTSAGFFDENGKQRHPWSCAPTVLMPASIVSDNTYIPSVEAGLVNLVGKPYTLIYAGGDQIFGEVHADMTDPQNPTCPAPLIPMCDQELFGKGRNCENQRTNPLNDGWVCRGTDGTQVFPYADKFKSILGLKSLYFFTTTRLERHWVGSHSVTRGLIRTALDEILQVPVKP